MISYRRLELILRTQCRRTGGLCNHLRMPKRLNQHEATTTDASWFPDLVRVGDCVKNRPGAKILAMAYPFVRKDRDSDLNVRVGQPFPAGGRHGWTNSFHHLTNTSFTLSIHPTMRTFEISYMLKTSSNSATQKATVQATDSVMARRIFEQQNPQCKVVSTPREVR